MAVKIERPDDVSTVGSILLVAVVAVSRRLCAAA